MTEIKPFKAVIYNQSKIKDLSIVVCPPYDIIPPAQQDYFHELSPNNLIHILLGKDIPGEDKYRKAALTFQDWQKQEILIQDKKPAIYFYLQQYSIKGEKKTRLGFICLLHLAENDSKVFGHEHTRLEPKEDRFSLIKQVKANLSPIFVIFKDHKRIIQRIYQQQVKEKEPFLDIIDTDKVAHKLWRIDSPQVLAGFHAAMSEEDVFIADGHHRYEVACAFRDEMKNKLGDKATGEENFNYILAYFTNTDSRGLSILPIHRFVKLNSQKNTQEILSELSEYFDLEKINDKTKFFFLLEKAGRTENLLGMYRDKVYWLLRLKNVKILDDLIADRPKEYRTLDLAILNRVVLNKVLGCDLEDKENITFSPDADEIIGQADKNPTYIAFLLNSVKIEQVMSVALGGNKMPSKSTYFYPKVLSGLVINKF